MAAPKLHSTHNCIRDRRRWTPCLIPGSKHSDAYQKTANAIRARCSANVGFCLTLVDKSRKLLSPGRPRCLLGNFSLLRVGHWLLTGFSVSVMDRPDRLSPSICCHFPHSFVTLRSVFCSQISLHFYTSVHAPLPPLVPSVPSVPSGCAFLHVAVATLSQSELPAPGPSLTLRHRDVPCTQAKCSTTQARTRQMDHSTTAQQPHKAGRPGTR